MSRLMRAVAASDEWRAWWHEAPVPTLELSWEFEPRLSKDVRVWSVRRGRRAVTARVPRTVFTLQRDGADEADGAALAREDVRSLLRLVAQRVGLPAPPPLGHH